MALSKAVDLKGVAFPNAYYRVVSLHTNRMADRVVVVVQLFAESLAAESPENALDTLSRVFGYSPEADVQWAYTQLKLLPEFAGAVDIL